MTSFVPTGGPLLLPPAIEDITITYLRPLLAPIPVGTRLPQPDQSADTINGFLRVESGGGTQANKTQWDLTVLLHGYSPDETTANDIANRAVSLMAVGRGQTLDGFYVVTVENAGVPARQTDPDVNLPRYFALVTWRMTGMPWTP
jgi:hypothetical protein